MLEHGSIEETSEVQNEANSLKLSMRGGLLDAYIPGK